MLEDKDLEDRKRQAAEDLNNEIAGRSVGRRARFLGDGHGALGRERKEREERSFRTRLLAMLSDPVYRAKYESVMRALERAERATEAALVGLMEQIDAAQEALRDIEERAARLPDGSYVFRDAHGKVRRADGTVVQEDLAATVLWTGDEPSFEEYVAQRTALEFLEQQRDETQGYQNDVLGDARHRLSDEDDPPTLDELNSINTRIETHMPDAVREALPADQPDHAPAPVSASPVPTLGN